MKSADVLDSLTEQLGYSFNDPAQLIQALTHRSHANEASGPLADNNERLEFLGDAVVGLVVSARLMQGLPAAAEGTLSKLRAAVVCEQSLASVAQTLNLGHYLRLGRGEQLSGGRQKSSLLANAFEAVVGAIYLDGGYAAACRVVESQLGDVIRAAVQGELTQDFKTQLQEYAQRYLHAAPTYAVLQASGPHHRRTFNVSVTVGTDELGRAVGTSKKQAEQAAARMALQSLEAQLNGKTT